MKKYIKSILTSRKQLMLLPLMLVSGGIMQAQTAVPDYHICKFQCRRSGNDDLRTGHEYGCFRCRLDR